MLDHKNFVLFEESEFKHGSTSVTLYKAVNDEHGFRPSDYDPII